VLIHIADFRGSQFVEEMRSLARIATPRLHVVTEDPAVADLILFSAGYPFESWYRGLLSSPLIHLYPEKCFLYSDGDMFIPVLPGAYASAKQGFLGNVRATGAPYITPVANPYIRPLRMERQYLFSFIGSSTSWVRKRLFRMDFHREDVLVEDSTPLYHHWSDDLPGREVRQRRYAEVIAQSHFALCPRGAGAGSIRMFEAMNIGVAPVVISDRWIPPEGPDWTKCSIRVAEKDLLHLPAILEERRPESAAMGAAANEEWQKYFASEKLFNTIVGACESVRRRRRIPERYFHYLRPLIIESSCIRWKTRQLIRSIVLRSVNGLGLRRLLPPIANPPWHE